MQTLLQTRLDLSEIATRMLAELFAHILGLLEPVFPLAFGEYGPVLSLANVLVLIIFAGLFGVVRDQLGATADLHKTPRSTPASTEADVTAKADTSMPVAAVALAATGLLGALLRYAVLSYLALSAVLFVARLLVGVS